MHELAQLIRDRMTERGWTYDAVAERGGIPKGTVWALVHRNIQAPPRISTIERLAAGLDLPVQTVSDAAARSTGYAKQEVATNDPNVRLLVHVAEQLGAEDREALVAMAEAYLTAAQKRKRK